MNAMNYDVHAKGCFFACLILLVTAFNCCTEPQSDSSSSNDDDSPGVFEQDIYMRFTIYVKNNITNAGISGAAAEWDRIGNWPGSIVYPSSGSADATGKIYIEMKFPYTITSYTVHVRRVYDPSGRFYAWNGDQTLSLRQGSNPTLTFYLNPR